MASWMFRCNQDNGSYQYYHISISSFEPESDNHRDSLVSMSHKNLIEEVSYGLGDVVRLIQRATQPV